MANLLFARAVGMRQTTTLRLIAGFERLDSGAILIDGVDQAGTPPHKRPVNTVFQSYALFPHMDVASNVAFGLRYRDVPKSQQQARVAEAWRRCVSQAWNHSPPSCRVASNMSHWLDPWS